MLKARYSALSITQQRVFWIVFILSIILAVFATAVFDTPFGVANPQLALVNALPALLVIVAFISAGLIFFGQSEMGAWVLLIGTLAELLTACSQAEGYGL